jgi:hypothetical protein
MAAAYGAAHLNDGTDVFLWMGIGYELREGRFQPAFDLGASRLCGEFTLPRGPDGFFHAGEYSKALWSSRRGEAPTRHLPKVEANIQWMSPGPQGSVLLKFGYSKRDGLGVLYFPEEEVYLRLEDELFPDEDPDDIRSLHWAGQCGRLIAVTPARLWAISIETVLALPRYNATTGRKLRS